MSIDHPIISPKKLIEVALPLDAINEACAYEKMPGIGAHPRGLHLWWARRPLAATRAVIFSQLVHDPEDLWRCQNPGIEPNKQVKGNWTKARSRLFTLIEDMVKWQNSGNEEVLGKAREEVKKAWLELCELNKSHPLAAELFDPNNMPGVHDPFAGGGAIPIEAQRLGLRASASDLNPVPVLINKAIIEIPPKFKDLPPASQSSDRERLLVPRPWKGVEGLAEDLRYYGSWIHKEAVNRIGHLYPKMEITDKMAKSRPDLAPYVGQHLAVIAWLWVRTVKSPTPAFSHAEVPLASSFILSNKKGSEAYVEPVVEGGRYRFDVKCDTLPEWAKDGTKLARGASFKCLLSGAPIDPKYIRQEAMSGRMGLKLMAVVVEGSRRRLYTSPEMNHEHIAEMANATEASLSMHVPIANDPRPMTCLSYGMTHFDQLFTKRQLLTLVTISDLIKEVRDRIRADAINSGWEDDNKRLGDDGKGADAYADAVSVYLAFALSRSADFSNSITRWVPGNQKVMNLFNKQAIPINWDFPEANLLEETVGGWPTIVSYIAKCLLTLPVSPSGVAFQADAVSVETAPTFISTDPPYYDNIGYDDLADFFYIWLRRSLREAFPSLLATISVPKAEELIAAPYRQGGRDAAEQFFLDGMTKAMNNLSRRAHPSAPVTIYYAFKQSDTAEDLTNSTGWETFLAAVLKAGFSIIGTWPVRSEQTYRQRGLGSNALASSVVLVCRPRKVDAGSVSRRDFIRQLNSALPKALDDMTRESEGISSPVAPVDLSQAIIGPGMAIFSRYDAVLEADGTPMSVKTALQLINRFLAEDDFDADTQFCLHWFEQYGWESGKFGEADTLARAKGTSVEGVKNAGVLHAAGGNVRLLKWAEYPTKWDPQSDQRLPVWEVLHQLIRVFSSEGESGAAAVYAAVQSKAEAARQLAYRLYTLCERKNWADDARAYNEVVTSWSAIETAAAQSPAASQRTLFDD